MNSSSSPINKKNNSKDGERETKTNVKKKKEAASIYFREYSLN